jgi:DNA-binding response OmpR family regulator
VGPVRREMRKSNKRVLIVEDDPRVAASMQDFLEFEYVVEVARDGEAALAAAAVARPDVVLLDINMPGINGLEVLKRIRHADPTVPVIMITGTQDDFAITTALMRGAFAYIPKPINGEYLLHVIGAALPADSSGLTGG